MRITLVLIVAIGVAVGVSLATHLFVFAQTTPKPKAALVMDASIDDLGWGTLHYKGLLALKDKLGYDVAFSEKVSAADKETTTRDYGDRGYNYIIMAGAQYTDVARTVAPSYPNTTFIVTQAVPPLPGKPYPPNMVGLDTINEQSGYLAGVLAAGMTKTNKIGIVSGVDYPNVVRWTEAFKLGAVTQNRNVSIFSTFTGDWDDVAKGFEAAKGQMDSGADVLWEYLDLGDVGAANAVKEGSGVWLIASTNDQSFLAPVVTLTSALQNMTNIVLHGVEQLNAGKLKGGQFYRWGVKENVTGLAPYHQTDNKIPPALKAKIQELKTEMITGKLVVPQIYQVDAYKKFLNLTH